MSQPLAAVFDLGGVLIDWNPRYLYKKLFHGNEAAMEDFLLRVCSPEWNDQQDAGRLFEEGCGLLKHRYPEFATLIDAWLPGYPQMLGGPISGTVEILSQLRSQGIPLYALSNWSAETFPMAVDRFDFLSWFRGVLISGEVRLVKPDPRIFNLFFERFNLKATTIVYIDDRLENVSAAAALGIRAIHYRNPASLQNALQQRGLLLP